jgi:hypothetical protein
MSAPSDGFNEEAILYCVPELPGQITADDPLC